MRDNHAEGSAVRQYEVTLVARYYRTVIVVAESPDDARDVATEAVCNSPAEGWEWDGGFDVYEVEQFDGSPDV